MSKIITGKRIRILAACAVLVLIIAFFTREDEPGFIEVERLKAFDRHSETSARARDFFELRYQQLSPESRTPAAIPQALGLEEPLILEPRPDGGHKAKVEMQGKYSNLILIWGASGELDGFAWELDTPAADNTSWQEHLESFAVSE